MMRTGIKSVAALAAASLLAVSLAHALTPAEQLYIKAESTQEPAEAIEHWRALLPEAEKGTLGKGITRDDLQINLVQSFIKLAEKTKERRALAEAQQTALQIKDAVRRAWMEIAIARGYAAIEDLNSGFALLDKVFNDAQKQPERQKNLIISGIIKTLSAPKDKSGWLFGQEGADKAKRLAMQLRDPESYASAMQASADAHASQEGANVADKSALVAKAEASLTEKNFPVALQSAMAVPLDSKKERNRLLLHISEESSKEDDWNTSLQALRGVMDVTEQSDAMVKVVETLIERKEISRAENLAAWISDGSRASHAYGLLAHAYQDLGYPLRMQDMLAKALASIAKVKDEQRSEEAHADLAKILADMGEVGKAEKILQNVDSDEAAYKAHAALAETLAETNQLDRAIDHFEALEDAPLELRIKPAAAIAKRLAGKGEPYKAEDVIDEDYHGPRIDNARLAIVKSFSKSGEFDDADAAVRLIKDVKTAAKANALIAVAHAKRGEKKEGSLLMAKALQATAPLPDDARYNAQEFIAQRYVELGMIQEAAKILMAVPLPKQRNAILQFARHDIEQGKINSATARINKLIGSDAYDWVASRAAIDLARKNHIEQAVRLTKAMKDATQRVLTFHKVAVIQAKHTDYYSILGRKEKALRDSEIQPNAISGKQLSKSDLAASEKQLSRMAKSEDSDLIVMDVGESSVGRTIPIPDTGKLSATYLDVRERIPVAKVGSVKRLLAEQSIFNSKFVAATGYSNFILAQQSYLPQIIYVESGVIDLPAIYDQLMLEGETDFIIKHGREYILRKPIVVGPKATLVISGADINELKLSEEGGAYIANAGNLYIVDTKVTGWSEKESRPSWRTYEEKKIFRPYITSWSESKTYMATTVFTALGYSNSKSYGISLSSGPKEYIRYRYDRLARPEAVIVDNSFDNLLYGFYSYEADNVVLVGNEYLNNTTYGIDPHDRSRWFTIAYNTAYEAKKKHGIIISREVNDSTILGNISFDNHGSGIMVDRQSSGTLIYANTAFDNEQDGVTIFESSCKIIASNQLFDNRRSGVRVRNSMDIGVYFNFIRNNVSAAVQGYVADLRNDPAHAHRDFELDPYSDVTALSVVGNWIEDNGSGILSDGMSALFLRKNRFVDQSPKLFRGNWSGELPRIMARHDIDTKGLLITSRCPRGTLLPYHCRFRDDGIFNGDGQNSLSKRIREDQCQGTVASNE